MDLGNKQAQQISGKKRTMTVAEITDVAELKQLKDKSISRGKKQRIDKKIKKLSGASEPEPTAVN